MEKIDELKARLAWYEERTKALEDELEEVRDCIENASVPMHWVDANGITIWANQAELDLLGYTKEEFIGKPIRDFHVDQTLFNDLLTRLSNNETLSNCHLRLKCKNGSVKDVMLNSSVLRRAGEFCHTRCFFTDVTEMIREEQHQAELLRKLEASQKMLIRSEKLFKSIALNIPNSLILIIDQEHRFVTIEGDLMEKMGYQSSNYAGKHPLDVGPSERYEAAKGLYQRVLSGEKFSTERKGATGEDYLVHFVPLRNEQNEVESALIIATDITEIKVAQEKSAKLAAIIESTDDAIISKSLTGIITSWNKAAERTFGYSAQEIIGESIQKLLPPDRQEEEAQILSRLSKGERVEHFETKRLKKDGSQLDVSLTISPVRDPHGNVIGLSKIARNITDKKQEEQRKNDFVAMVSHELKTPLTAITSYVQMVLSKLKQENHSFEVGALSRADAQARKMASMIHDFLSLARLEEGKIQMNKQDFELHPLMEEIAGDAQFISNRHNVKLQDCEHMMVHADRDKIGQVLANLLSNAIKYSPLGGEIIIGCEKTGESVRIFVKDRGVGISAANQRRLFERFYRVRSENTKSISGFGIGLYLITEILRYHDTEIHVESEEGKGSTFYFSLDILG